jgi:clan AA aspartic protease
MTVKTSYHKYKRTEGTSLTGGKKMGLVYAEIELVNNFDLELNRRGMLADTEIRSTRHRALVDSGAFDLVINEDIRRQLDVPVLEQRTIWLADDTTRQVDMVGPIEVRFENRSATVRAIVLPGSGEVLLGAIPMEVLDVFIDPRGERLIVNPLSTDQGSSRIKRVA